MVSGQRRERAGADLGGDHLLLAHALGRIAPDVKLQDENAERIEVVREQARAPAERIGDRVLDGFVEHGLGIARRHAETLAEHDRALVARLVEEIVRPDRAMRYAELRQLADRRHQRRDHVAYQLRLGHRARRRRLAAEHAPAFRRIEDQRRAPSPHGAAASRSVAILRYRPVDDAAAARPHHRRIGRRLLGESAEIAARQVGRRDQGEHRAPRLVAVIDGEGLDAGRIELGQTRVRRNFVPPIQQDLIVRHRQTALCAHARGRAFCPTGLTPSQPILRLCLEVVNGG
jgi:hypothetical protein